MSHITITFETDGAAFEDTSDGEYRRIFSKIASQIADDFDNGSVRDINGNNIGDWEIVREEEPS